VGKRGGGSRDKQHRISTGTTIPNIFPLTILKKKIRGRVEERTENGWVEELGRVGRSVDKGIPRGKKSPIRHSKRGMLPDLRGERNSSDLKVQRKSEKVDPLSGGDL